MFLLKRKEKKNRISHYIKKDVCVLSTSSNFIVTNVFFVIQSFMTSLAIYHWNIGIRSKRVGPCIGSTLIFSIMLPLLSYRHCTLVNIFITTIPKCMSCILIIVLTKTDKQSYKFRNMIQSKVICLGREAIYLRRQLNCKHQFTCPIIIILIFYVSTSLTIHALINLLCIIATT